MVRLFGQSADCFTRREAARRKGAGRRLDTATRKDIAGRLNVSVSVVSRALNGTGYVRQDKREQILAMARELGYTREPAALVRTGRSTGQILFCCSNIRNPFNVELYNGILEAAIPEGYNVLLTAPMEKNVRAPEADGLIFSNEVMAVACMNTTWRSLRVPAVTAAFGEHLRMPRPIPIIECDLWRGTEALVNYLKRKGHRRIAMVSPYSMEANNTRGFAWRACMEGVLGERVADYYIEAVEHGPEFASPGQDAFAFEGFFENGFYAASRFLESGCDATAVICFNEEMALGFCRALQHRGVSVPADLSLVSYDGTFMRHHYELPLTVLDLHPKRMGVRCFQVLADVMAGRRVRRARIQPEDILEGASVRDISE